MDVVCNADKCRGIRFNHRSSQFRLFVTRDDRKQNRFFIMLVCTFGTVDDRYPAPHPILDAINYALWFRGHDHDLHLLLLCVNHVHYARIDKNAECRIKGIRPAKNGPAARMMKKLKIRLIVPMLLPVCFLIVSPKISKPPVEIPFLSAKPVPNPLIVAPKIAQMIGSFVKGTGLIALIMTDEQKTAKIVNSVNL